MGKNKLGWLFKHEEPDTFDYCTIEKYDTEGYVISIPARYFIKTVRSLIKTAKTRLEQGESPEHLGVRVIFKEQMEENVLCGEIFSANNIPDNPLFTAKQENENIVIEVDYNIRIFNGKILDFTNHIIRTINKFDDKAKMMDKPVRICIPDINDSFVEFNWSGK